MVGRVSWGNTFIHFRERVPSVWETRLLSIVTRGGTPMCVSSVHVLTHYPRTRGTLGSKRGVETWRDITDQTCLGKQEKVLSR